MRVRLNPTATLLRPPVFGVASVVSLDFDDDLARDVLAGLAHDWRPELRALHAALAENTGAHVHLAAARRAAGQVEVIVAGDAAAYLLRGGQLYPLLAGDPEAPLGCGPPIAHGRCLLVPEAGDRLLLCAGRRAPPAPGELPALTEAWLMVEPTAT